MDFVNINGKLFRADEARISFDDRAFRYGDGLFETIKIRDGKILLEQFHFERLLQGLQVLKFETDELFLAEKLKAEIIRLCEKNNCIEECRVRLTISRGSGSLQEFHNHFNIVIEASPIKNQEQSASIAIDIFPDARKSCDIYSNLKTSNFLPYVMAAKFAIENQLDDCLVLNIHGRICDSTISNIFWIKDKEIFTPPLSEGCVAGVMRRWMLEKVQGTRYKVQERVCESADLKNADEIFLTNVIRGIRPVNRFKDQSYRADVTNSLIETTQKLIL